MYIVDSNRYESTLKEVVTSYVQRLNKVNKFEDFQLLLITKADSMLAIKKSPQQLEKIKELIPKIWGVYEVSSKKYSKYFESLPKAID